jgi:hypothetical protein
MRLCGATALESDRNNQYKLLRRARAAARQAHPGCKRLASHRRQRGARRAREAAFAAQGRVGHALTRAHKLMPSCRSQPDTAVSALLTGGREVRPRLHHVNDDRVKLGMRELIGRH